MKLTLRSRAAMRSAKSICRGPLCIGAREARAASLPSSSSIATFASAQGFLQSNEINDTECVISDVQMPGLSGVELQSQLIADGNRTPIIFITASLEERTRAGAEGWRNWRPEQALQRGVAYAVAGSLNCCGK